MAIIRAKNSLTDNALYSYLSNGEASGVGTVTVGNINNFTANHGVQIGATGNEQSEVLIIGGAAPSGSTIIFTGNTRYDHPIDTPVYDIIYDQIIFKCSTTGTAGTATAMTSGTVTITPDSEYTQFIDTSGTTGYAYKVQYYNSVTASTTDESSWLEIAGYSDYSLSKMRDRIKNKLFNYNFIKSDSAIDEWINEWLEGMNNALDDVNKDYNLGTADVAIGTSGLGTITSSDYKDIKRVWMSTDGATWYKAEQKDSIEVYPTETYSESYPFFYYQGDNVIGKLPISAGTARIMYYKQPTRLSDETDELPVPMRSYTKSFVDYALGQCFYLDNKDDKAKEYLGEARMQLAIFKDQVASRHKSGAEYVQLVDETGSENEYWI
jgi:hypothetical protein